MNDSKFVVDAADLDWPPGLIPESEAAVGKLTARKRDDLKGADFALPAERKYPMENENHARMAIAMVDKYGSEDEKKRVRAAVRRKFPSIQVSGD